MRISRARAMLAATLLLLLALVGAACSSGSSTDLASDQVADDATEQEDQPAADVSDADTAAEDTESEPDAELGDEADDDADDDIETQEDTEDIESSGDDDVDQGTLADAPSTIGFFFDGALVEDPTVGECVLSDGTTSQCYTLVVAGNPVNHEVGPYCPTSITDDADAGGLWLDGGTSYELDGEFFTELADIYGDELWDNIYNDDGSINVIDNAEDFQAAARPNVTEDLYFNCVEGEAAWLTGGVQPTYTMQIPVIPVATGAVTVAFQDGAHSNLGATLNGALLSGSAAVDAILDAYTIAAFDDCGGHVNPALGYHVHGTSGCSDLEIEIAESGETAPFAIALDGHTIHAPLPEGSDVELDECNGHWSDEFGYHYHANSLEQNATLTCLTGLVTEGQDNPAAPGGSGGGPPRERPAPAE